MHFNFMGLIFVAGGVYALLLAHGVVRGSTNAGAMEAWRQKYGRILKISAPIVVLFGIGEFLGLFS